MPQYAVTIREDNKTRKFYVTAASLKAAREQALKRTKGRASIYLSRVY